MTPGEDREDAARREDEPESPAFLEDGTPVTFQTFMLRAIPGEPGASEVDKAIAEMEKHL